MNFHNDKFTERVDSLKQRMEIGELVDRKYRLLNIHLAIKEHVLMYRERPPRESVADLADMTLSEELNDTHPDKVTRAEYPILSDEQIARRQEGKHVKNSANTRIEVPLDIAENYGVDGRYYGECSRRKRSGKENTVVNEAKSRNVIRQLKYEAFINGEDYAVTEKGSQLKITFLRKNVKI